MNIVFLNLADNDPVGIASKAVKALNTKYPKLNLTGWRSWIYGENSVTEYNLIPLLDGHSAKLGDQDVSSAVIGAHCERADKVMLAIHGNYDNRDQGVVTMGFGVTVNRTLTLDALCNIVEGLLPGAGGYNLTLIMCYGARTVNYRLDQFSGQVDWSSSFAYKFYERLRVGREIRMVAFTGAVSLDEASGKFTIQTEAAVSAEIDLKENEAAYTEAVGHYNKLMDGSEKADAAEYYKRYQLLSRENRNAKPSDAEHLRDGYAIVDRYTQIIVKMNEKSDKAISKGKIIFLRPNQTTIVFTKHPELRILYPDRLSNRGER